MNKMTFKNCQGETFELDLLPLDDKRKAVFNLTKNVAGVSHRETERALKTAVNFVTDVAGDYWVWVDDVYDDKFVYEIDAKTDAAGLWERPYTIDSNLMVTIGDASRVIARRVYEPAPAQPATMQNQTWNKIKNYVSELFTNHDKERNMKEMIAAIVTNGKTGMTAEQLGQLPETAVSAMFNGLQLNEEDEPEAADGSIGGEPATPAPAAAEVPAWAADLVAKVDGLAGKVDGLSKTANAATEQQKTAIVKKLVANERVAFTEAELQAFTLPQLEKLSATVIEPDYSGLFFGQNEQSEYEYVGVTINAKKEEAK